MIKRERPPLGLIKRWCWLELRIGEIDAAIERFRLANRKVPKEWEMERIVRALELQKARSYSSGEILFTATVTMSSEMEGCLEQAMQQDAEGDTGIPITWTKSATPEGKREFYVISRFDYIAYDEISNAKQTRLKACAQKVEAALNELKIADVEFRDAICEELPVAGDAGNVHATALDELDEMLPENAMQHLEQAYMWCGKAVTDDQLKRNGKATVL